MNLHKTDYKIEISFTMKLSLSLALLLLLKPQALAFTASDASSSRCSALKASTDGCEDDNSSRRHFLTSIPTTAMIAAAVMGANPSMSLAAGASDGNLPDLPSEAVRSYLQYRVPLQIAADFYIFDYQAKITDLDQWGEVGQLFRVNNNKGQGSPSKIERDFVNPMRILLLSMPPDVSDDMRDAQFRFEKAMNSISKATSGYRKDLPVEIPASTIVAAQQGWEDGRVALNDFFVLMNGVTGLDELQTIPAAGPKQREQYGRSYNKFNDLVKKTKLCQNRGGPALSQAWGQLMVSGYLQDSCGIPDLDGYFYQKKT